MPYCSNCGGFVTADYARVFTPNDTDDVRACPDCPDRIRVDGQVRDARSTRSGGKPPRTNPTNGGEEA